MAGLTDFERIAISHIEESTVVPLLQELIRIPSVGSQHGEGRAAATVAEFLERKGVGVELQEVLPGRPNVIGTVGSDDGKVLLFNAHMDTVPAGDGWRFGPFDAEIRDGRVYGRGAVDDKGPLAAMLTAASVLSDLRSELNGRLVVCAVVDEENASRGSKDLMNNLRGDFGLVGEPTAGQIVIAHNGSIRPVLKVTGRVAHTSRPEDGINAISKMGKVVEAIDSSHVLLRKRTHPLTGSASVCVSMISGGTQPNLIPDACTALVDRRLTPSENEPEVMKELEQMLDRLCASDPELDVRIESYQPTTGGPAQIAPDATIVRMVQAAVQDIGAEPPALRGLGGACDMVHLVNAGVEAAVFGPGDPAMAHQTDENVEIRELIRCAQVYLLVALRLLSSENPGWSI